MNEPIGASLVLVVPCFNEAERLRLDAFAEALARAPGLRFLFVDDGSTDATAERVGALAAAEPERVSVLRLEINSGKGEAVRLGILQALGERADFVGYWDADLSTPLAEAAELASAFEGHAELLAVFGSRVRLLGKEIRRNPVRHYLGRVFATAVSLLLDVEIYDSQCGAKVFRNDPAVAGVFADPFVTRWIFDVEIVARLAGVASARGLEVEDLVHEFPLASWHDVSGSKLRLADYAGAVRDLFVLRRRYGRGHRSGPGSAAS